MWGKGKKRFGGGGEPAAKRQAAGDDGPSEPAEDGTVVAEVWTAPNTLFRDRTLGARTLTHWIILMALVQISKNKKVSVRSWKGRVYVDLREFYVKDGKTLPTRKGTTSDFCPLLFLWVFFFPPGCVWHPSRALQVKVSCTIVSTDGFSLGLD
jgi:hypothetical protein